MVKANICYIDDCDNNLILIQKYFSGTYQVTTIDSPKNAIAQLIDKQPDLVLLDVNMPEIDGYELCRSIRKESSLKDVPVVFLTCRTSVEDRLTGMDAGGDAYITKPFVLEEVKYIVSALVNRHRRMREIAEKVQYNDNMIWMMMRNNSEIGHVVEYARALSHTRDEETLLKHTFATLGNFGLNSTVLLKLNVGEAVCRADRKPFTPIEAELLQLAKDGGRIVSAGSKYMFSGANCIFLVKNMPVDDDALTGRLRDHVAIMLESCDNCIELINYRQKELQEQENAVSKTQASVMREFENVIALFDNVNDNARTSFERLIADIEGSFMFLALSEEQEEQLTRYVEKAKAEIDQYMDDGAVLQDAMTRIAESIRDLSMKNSKTESFIKTQLSQ